MATKAFLSSLKRDQIFQGRIEVVLSQKDVVCNIDGNLLQVENHTGAPMARGTEITLQVESVEPLRLSIFSEKRFKRVV